MAIYADKKDGKPTGRWRVEVQVDGKRARGRFDTIEEARKAEAEWIVQFPVAAKAREDKRGVPKRLKDLVEKTEGALWKGKESRELSEARLARVVSIIGPQTPLESIETPLLDKVVATLLKDAIEPSTVNKYLSTLHKLLAWGRDRKWFGELPVFPWQDEDAGRIRWITDEEEPQLLSLLSPEVSVLTRVAIATGMRRGELLGLEPKQVERGWVHLWKTKTKVPRSVPITEATYDDIRWLLDIGMPTEHMVRYQWDKAREAMGLMGDEWFTFHVTRHTCATRLVQANVNLRLIQKWLGHKRIETTIRYAQVSDHMLSAALSQAEVFRLGVLDTSPTVGYRATPDIAASSASNLKRTTGARSYPLCPPKVAIRAVRHAGVVKLADTQDLGSGDLPIPLKDLELSEDYGEGG